MAFDPIVDEALVCPTCKAGQEWSDTCRRCRSDISLLRQVAEACRASYHRALIALRTGRLADALDKAERAYALCPSPRCARLLAVCRLLEGDMGKAMEVAKAAIGA